MSQNQKNVCFYSNKDKWSKAFIEELSKTPWMREFDFQCVDTDKSGNKPNLPKWLKQVPTLVIAGDESPVKTDTEVMNWLYEKKMKTQPSKPTAPASSTQALLDGPQSWMGGEMSGYGDTGYSFVDADMTTAGNGGATIPGSFTFLQGFGDKQSDSSLTTAVQNQGTRSKKEAVFDKQMDMYKQQRDLGIPQGPARQ
jgi:hypothetical protein